MEAINLVGAELHTSIQHKAKLDHSEAMKHCLALPRLCRAAAVCGKGFAAAAGWWRWCVWWWWWRAVPHSTSGCGVAVQGEGRAWRTFLIREGVTVSEPLIIVAKEGRIIRKLPSIILVNVVDPILQILVRE